MKRSICALFAGLIVLGSVNPSFAGRLADADSITRPKAKWVPEMVTYVGEVRRKAGCEDWEFVREVDGKVFDLKGNRALASVTGEKETAHLKVKLEAEKKPRFLFWGGELVAKSVKVLAELPVHLCANLEKTNRDPSAFPRTGGKASML